MNYAELLVQVREKAVFVSIDVQFMLCSVTGKVVTKRECMELTCDPNENKFCKSGKCKSAFRICPTCNSQGEKEKMGGHIPQICCQKGKDYCVFHSSYEIKSRRSETERKEAMLEFLKSLEEIAHRAEEIGAVEKQRTQPQQKKKNIQKKQSVQKNVQSGRLQGIIDSQQRLLQRQQLELEQIDAEMSTQNAANLAAKTSGDDACEESSAAKKLPLQKTIHEMAMVEFSVEKIDPSPVDEPAQSLVEDAPENESSAQANEDAFSVEVAGETALVEAMIAKTCEIPVSVETVLPVQHRRRKLKKNSQKSEVNASAVSEVAEKFKCALGKQKMLSEKDCTCFCSSFNNNKRCRESECESPWLICIACIAFGEYPRYGAECYVSDIDEKNGVALCATHLEIGQGERRQSEKGSTLLPDIDVQKISPISPVLVDAIRKPAVPASSKPIVSQSALQNAKSEISEHERRDLLAIIDNLHLDMEELQAEIDLLKGAGADSGVLEKNAALEKKNVELEKHVAETQRLLSEKDAFVVGLQQTLIERGLHIQEVEESLRKQEEKNLALILEKDTSLQVFQTEALQARNELSATQNSLESALGENEKLQQRLQGLENLLKQQQMDAQKKGIPCVELEIHESLPGSCKKAIESLKAAIRKYESLTMIITDLEKELISTTRAILNQQKAHEGEVELLRTQLIKALAAKQEAPQQEKLEQEETFSSKKRAKKSPKPQKGEVAPQVISLPDFERILSKVKSFKPNICGWKI